MKHRIFCKPLREFVEVEFAGIHTLAVDAARVSITARDGAGFAGVVVGAEAVSTCFHAVLDGDLDTLVGYLPDHAPDLRLAA